MTVDELKAFAKKGVECEIGVVEHAIENRFCFNDMSPTESVRHLLNKIDASKAKLQEIDTMRILVVS